MRLVWEHERACRSLAVVRPMMRVIHRAVVSRGAVTIGGVAYTRERAMLAVACVRMMCAAATHQVNRQSRGSDDTQQTNHRNLHFPSCRIRYGDDHRNSSRRVSQTRFCAGIRPSLPHCAGVAATSRATEIKLRLLRPADFFAAETVAQQAPLDRRQGRSQLAEGLQVGQVGLEERPLSDQQ
jgi:hypothetical protein